MAWLLVRHLGGQHARLRAGELQRGPERAEPVRGRHRRVQVVVEYPVHRGPALGLRVVPLGLVGRVGAEQVVEREPGGQVLGHHVGPGQLAQRGARVGAGHPGQAGRRRQRDVGAGMHAEQAEHPRRGLGELVVGPGEHGPHVGHRVPGLERVQPAPGVPQLGGEFGQRALGPAGRAADHDAQGQREPGARGDDLARRLWFGRDPVLAEPAGEHLVGLGVAEHVERERHRALGGHQPGHLVAAGHHDQGAGRAGQQRPDLSHVARVVQDDQHPLAVQQAAEQRGPAVDVGRDPVRRHAQRVEEEPQRLGWLKRQGGRIQAAQVDEELAIGEPPGDLAAEPDGECGLPRSRRARDDHDRHGLVGPGLARLARLPAPAARRLSRRFRAGSGARLRRTSRAASPAAC